MQFKSNLGKEILFLTRTKRLILAVFVFLAFGVIDVGSVRLLDTLVNFYDDTLIPTLEEQSGTDIPINMGSLMDVAYGENGPSAYIGIASGLADISSIGILVLLVVLIPVSGGEQKKRSIIIPQCAGLKSFNYVTPKFLLYPLMAWILTIINGICTYGCSLILFDVHDISLGTVLIAYAILGFFMAFVTTVHLCIGLSTARPGVSTAIVFIGVSLLSTFFSAAGIGDKFNPFALVALASNTLAEDYIKFHGGTPTQSFTSANIIFTFLITIILMVLMFAITMLVQNVKRVDNSGDTAYI